MGRGEPAPSSPHRFLPLVPTPLEGAAGGGGGCVGAGGQLGGTAPRSACTCPHWLPSSCQRRQGGRETFSAGFPVQRTGPRQNKRRVSGLLGEPRERQTPGKRNEAAGPRPPRRESDPGEG